MRTSRTLALPVATAALALSAAPAWSQGGGCTGAPGASALVQYCEAVPAGDGSRQKPGQQGGGSRGASQSTLGAIAGSGQDGQRLARALGGDQGDSASKGKGAGKDSKASGSGSGSGGSGAGGSGSQPGTSGASGVSNPPEPSGGALSAAREAVSSGPTAGQGVTWALLGMSAFGALSAVLLRRRGGASLRDDTDES